MDTNFFKSTESNPYHLSVEAVLVNENKDVCCHYFETFTPPEDPVVLDDFYILMRETLENGESLEGAVLRGIKEEFGAKGNISAYLGSIKSGFDRNGRRMEKMTVYFLIESTEFDLANREKDDEERISEIQWQTFDFLISKMKAQGERYKNRTDLDESIILERAKNSLYKL